MNGFLIKINWKLYSLGVLFFIFYILNPLGTLAAEFSFSYPAKIGLDQQFQINVLVNSQRENINALEGKIIYDATMLSLQEVREAGTPVSLWVTDPGHHKNDGVVEFSGITPGGFNTADQDTQVFSLIFKTLREGRAQIQAQNFIALLNDGQGTNAKVTISKLPKITIDKNAESSDQVSVIADQEPPEPPFIEIIRDASIENGQWVAVFYAQDKNSGINHYEIAEQAGRTVSDYNTLNWKTGQSPYLLVDQTRKSTVYLKVIDNAGNETVVTISPTGTQLYKNIWFWCIIIVALLLLYLGGFVWRKKKYLKVRR